MRQRNNIYKNRNANASRFAKIIDMQSEVPRCNRKNGFIISCINGIWTIINIKPNPRNIRQWEATINGVFHADKTGLGSICDELARINPPARNFF